jgi:hypothetical protein
MYYIESESEREPKIIIIILVVVHPSSPLIAYACLQSQYH